MDTARHPALALAAALLSACSDAGPTPGLPDELLVNRARWEATRPVAYGYTVERLCFCGEEARGPAHVRVSGATVIERRYVDGGGVVPAQLAPLFPTVDGLFATLQDALDRGAAEIRVTWDPASGVPLDVWIDYDARTADEETGFRVVGLPEPEG